jgi:hypothetical protein
MNLNELNEEEMDKYDSALVAILDKIRIIHRLGMHKQLLADLVRQSPDELEELIQQALRMNIGQQRLRKYPW